jgi:hypothetical protein
MFVHSRQLAGIFFWPPCCCGVSVLPIHGIDRKYNRVFGLRNELVYHLLTFHYFCLVCGIE